MKKAEFEESRNLILYPADGGDAIEYSSFAQMTLDYNEEVNKENWAHAHENVVFVCNRFDTIGQIVERFETNKEADNYADALNRCFAMCEEHNVWED